MPDPTFKKAKSIVFILLAVAVFALTTLMAKALGTPTLGQSLHPLQISAGRFCFALIFVAPVFFLRGRNSPTISWSLHIGRSILGWLGVTCLFAASAQIPLSDANAVNFLSVIVTMVLSIYLLREHVTATRWVAAAVSLIGALIIIRPGTDAFQPAALLAVFAALFTGIEMIFIKLLSDRDRPFVILMINNTMGAIISLSAALYFWITPNLQQWLVLAGIGLAMAFVQFFNILALRISEASWITPFWYATPAFAAFYDLWLFHQPLSLFSVLGIVLIIIGGGIISSTRK